MGDPVPAFGLLKCETKSPGEVSEFEADLLKQHPMGQCKSLNRFLSTWFTHFLTLYGLSASWEDHCSGEQKFRLVLPIHSGNEFMGLYLWLHAAGSKHPDGGLGITTKGAMAMRRICAPCAMVNVGLGYGHSF